MPGHSPQSSDASVRAHKRTFLRKSRAVVAVAATVALLATTLVVFGAQPAAALVGTPFEIDGNDQALAGGLDWSNFPTANLVDEADVSNSNSDDSFGGADEDEYIDVPVVSQGVPTNNDLTRFRLAIERREGMDFLYLAWNRLPSNGTTTISFELNKLAQDYPGPGKGNGNEWDILRSEGDVLITFNLGSSGNDPELYISRWLVTNTPATPCAVANNTAPCWSVPVLLPLGGTVADAAVDFTQNAQGARVPPIFGEAAINLTAANILPAGSCETFANSYAKTRSSLPLGSDLQDLVYPTEQVVISNCGSLSVEKTVVDDPGTNTFDFTVDCGDYALTSANLDDDAVDYTTSAGDAKFSLGDGESKLFVDIPDGTQCSVVEAAETTAGGTWTTTYTVHAGQPQSGNNTGMQALAAGETSAVAFTNDFDTTTPPPPPPPPPPTFGSLVVDKVATNGNGTFTFDVDCDGTTFDQQVTVTTSAGSGSSAPITDIPDGAGCTVTELAQTGWTATSPTVQSTFISGRTTVTFRNDRQLIPAPEVDLSITKTDDVDPITVGTGNVTYTLVITNNSVTDATDVVVSDRLPSTVTFSAASDGCTHSDGIVTCVVGDLAAGDSATATVAVTPTVAGVLVNTASVSGNEPDPDLENNTDTEDTRVVEVLGEVATRPPVAPAVPTASPPAVRGATVARTGSTPGPLVLSALLAIMLGGLMLIAAGPERSVRRADLRPGRNRHARRNSSR